MLEKGRKFRSEKNNKEALIYYNLAIAYAPHPSNGKKGNHSKVDDEDVSDFFVALAERSELLLLVRGGEEALRDIDFSLDLLKDKKGAESVRTELEERKDKCNIFLEEKQSFMVELARDSLEEQEKRYKYKNLLLFKIKQPNALIPAAEQFVEIRESETK